MSMVIDEALQVVDGLELTDEEIAKLATKMLHARGFAVKIFGREDVAHRVNQLDHVTAENKEKVIDHIMQGDDWVTMEEENHLEDGNFWALISGTRHDHPDWFESDATA